MLSTVSCENFIAGLKMARVWTTTGRRAPTGRACSLPPSDRSIRGCHYTGKGG
jgi:hypothetical protein